MDYTVMHIVACRGKVYDPPVFFYRGSSINEAYVKMQQLVKECKDQNCKSEYEVVEYETK